MTEEQIINQREQTLSVSLQELQREGWELFRENPDDKRLVHKEEEIKNLQAQLTRIRQLPYQPYQ